MPTFKTFTPTEKTRVVSVFSHEACRAHTEVLLRCGRSPEPAAIPYIMVGISGFWGYRFRLHIDKAAYPHGLFVRGKDFWFHCLPSKQALESYWELTPRETKWRGSQWEFGELNQFAICLIALDEDGKESADRWFIYYRITCEHMEMFTRMIKLEEKLWKRFGELSIDPNKSQVRSDNYLVEHIDDADNIQDQHRTGQESSEVNSLIEIPKPSQPCRQKIQTYSHQKEDDTDYVGDTTNIRLSLFLDPPRRSARLLVASKPIIQLSLERPIPLPSLPLQAILYNIIVAKSMTPKQKKAVRRAQEVEENDSMLPLVSSTSSENILLDLFRALSPPSQSRRVS